MQIQKVHKQERILVAGAGSRRARRKNVKQSFMQKLLQPKKHCPGGENPAHLNT